MFEDSFSLRGALIPISYRLDGCDNGILGGRPVLVADIIYHPDSCDLIFSRMCSVASYSFGLHTAILKHLSSPGPDLTECFHSDIDSHQER